MTSSKTIPRNENAVDLESVITTAQLSRRPSRPPEIAAENRALVELAQEMATSPDGILQKLAETALSLCHAHSAGFSLLEPDGKRFRWPAIVGQWACHMGGGSLRDYGPCGTVLDRNAPQLMSRPERYFDYLAPVTPPMEEVLLIPFYVEGTAVGTIWVMSHDPSRRFDAEDLRVMTSLGAFAAAAYQVLRASEHAYRTLVEALPVAVYTTDAQGHITLFNRAAAEFAGRVPELGTDSWSVMWKMYQPNGTPLPHNQGPLAVALREDRPVHGQEIIIERPDGTRANCLPYPTPLHDPSGKLVGAVNLVVDITERNQVEEALRQSQERLGQTNADLAQRVAQLQKASAEVQDSRRAALNVMEDVFQARQSAETLNLQLRTEIAERIRVEESLRQSQETLLVADCRKDEFLAMLAHELRNPLAPISNAVQVLRFTGGDGKAVQSAAEMIERQVGQMVRLVDDLLDVSRISRGKIELRKERIELASAVYHAVEAARPNCERMDHELTVALPPQPMYLNADRARLAQVVGNLLTNACKFTDKGGRICLTVEREGVQAVIRVRDNGIGIAADQLPRIFDMFTQLDTSLERSVSGLGIGLTLVKNLVELHGGTVGAHSAGIGHGSEFTVRLPILVETPKLSPPEPTASEPTPTTARRILVVDDNRDSATSLVMLLELSGHEMHTAYDGLEAAATFRPHVVLLDIGLPKLNGYEAARQIREQLWGKDMVLVALTGWGHKEARQKSRDAGFNGHIVKPVELPALVKLLAETAQAALRDQDGEQPGNETEQAWKPA